MNYKSIGAFVNYFSLNFLINNEKLKIYCCLFVSAEYAKLPLIPPYLQPGNHKFTYGSNFASSGAGALRETRPEMVNILSFCL